MTPRAWASDWDRATAVLVEPLKAPERAVASTPEMAEEPWPVARALPWASEMEVADPAP